MTSLSWRTLLLHFGLGKSTSLGGKLILTLTLVGLVGSAAIALFLVAIITPSFDELEQRAVMQHVERTRAALDEYGSKVEVGVRDYGDWTQSYDYMAAPSRAFEEESFATLAMVNLDINGMAYVASDGRIIISRWIDLGTEADIAPMRVALDRLIASTDIVALLGKQSSGKFYARIGGQVIAFGVAQVRRSDGTGTPRGHVLMAREITSERLGTLLQLNAALNLGDTSATTVVAKQPTSLNIAVPIAGIGGRTVAMATYSIGREITLLGQRLLIFAVAGSIILLLFVLLMLRRVISRLVIAPLHLVERHMEAVSASGSLGLLAQPARDDEIGSLVSSFNSMLAQLKDLRQQLEVQSFELGRSESAIAVMHNVRNGLNPVSTILSHGLSRTTPIDRATVDRALSELADDMIPAARRQKLVAYVAAAIEAESSDRAGRRNELAEARGAMHNVLEIIGQQQELVQGGVSLDPCDILEIISQNASIARYSMDREIAFTCPSAAPALNANRIILSQVVGNLFANAAEAISASGREDGHIMVTVVENEDQSVDIAIEDNGEGFDPDISDKLFQRGFSTRENRAGGLGLHWCANSIKGMNGELHVTSAGKGMGATAIIRLARAPETASVSPLRRAA